MHAGFEDEDETEADSDYSGGDLSEESEDSQTDQSPIDEENLQLALRDEQPGPITDGRSAHFGRIKWRRQARPAGLGLRARTSSVDENGDPNAQMSTNRLLEMLEDNEQAEEPELTAPVKRRSQNSDAKKRQRNHPETAAIVRGNANGRNASANGKSVRFDEAELATPATVRLGSSDDSEHDGSEPVSDMGSVSDKTDESDKENAGPPARKSKPVAVSFTYV